MKKLRLIEEKPWRMYTEDVERLISVAKRHGYELSEEDAYRLWREHSDSYAAGWMAVGHGYDESELWWVIKGLTEEV